MLRCDPYFVDKSVKEKKMKKMERRHFLKTLFGGAAGMGFIHPSRKHRIFPEVLLNTPNETDALVQILGTAQDGGFPQIGCYCKNCLRARENALYSRLISSLAILDLHEKKYFLLDATPDIRHQSDMILDRLMVEKQGKRNAPDGILLTHAHIGHYTGLMFYGYEAMSTERLPVHCTSRMGHFLSKNGPWSQLVRLNNISLHTFLPGKKFLLTPRISLTPFLVPHRNEYSDTLGFRISGEKKNLLYIPDIQSWEAWNRSIVEETERVDIALLDGTFYSPEELPGRDIAKIGHPLITTSLKTLGSVAKKGQTQICFTHLNHTNLALEPDGDARKEIRDRGFRLASDGQEFFL
jgi:pyrroloquinoline quinone biosynthesis protein B